RMRRWGASEKKGRPPATRRCPAGLRGEPPPPIAGVHRGRSDARRGTVDQPVLARVIATTGRDGHPGKSSHHPTAAAEAAYRLPHGAEEQEDGPTSQLERASTGE